MDRNELIERTTNNDRIFCRGGRTGRKIHKSAIGSSVLTCGKWLKTSTAHFKITDMNVIRNAKAEDFCEKCFYYVTTTEQGAE